jgi:hypothetical protein
MFLFKNYANAAVVISLVKMLRSFCLFDEMSYYCNYDL